MDGGVVAFAVSSSPWSLVRGYFSFSPATLFLLLNMVIGTIALTSRSRRRDDDDGHHHHHHRHVNDDQQPRHQYAAAPPPPPPAPEPLARTSSVMDRLRSLGLGLYRFRSGDFPPEYNHHLSESAATHDGTSVTKKDQAQFYGRSRSEPGATRPPPPPAPRNNNGNKDEDHRVVVVKNKKSASSGSEVERLERDPPPTGLLVRRAPRGLLVAREEEEAARSVDARADDFISKFRQQLQLQRLNSLLNYKEMLNRGV